MVREGDSALRTPNPVAMPPQYRMTLSLNVLNHLGIGLYSNIPAVLSELVANAWDADASNVLIQLNIDAGVIEVTDDGCGMTMDDINDRFLKVGYQRRQHDTTTQLGRLVMGRKGIGKLATFAIARVVEVHTRQDDHEPFAFRMDRQDIEERIRLDDSATYNPEPISPQVSGMTTGTRLVLRELDKALTRTGPHLKRRLARRFSIIGQVHDFRVLIDGESIGPQDRAYYDKLEFIWTLGGDATQNSFGSIRQTTPMDSTIRIGGQNHDISGWIGTVDRPETLNDVNNSIVLLSRGRLVHENILPDFKEAGVYAQYIVGEINADFLDNDGEDIVTSGRQSVKEDDLRYKAVKEFVHRALRRIRDQWATLRKEDGTKRALVYPSISEWYGQLGPDRKRMAKNLFVKIESLALPDVAAKKEIYKASILAFEKLSLRDMLSDLDNIETERDFQVLSRLIRGIDEVEAVHYYDIVKGRLGVIRKLINIAPTALEKILQDFIFDHLWLLHPSLERATSDAHIESTVMREFSTEGNLKLSDEEKRGRIDIRYRTAVGTHVIVELKRHEKAVKTHVLVGQLRKYRNALQKCLSQRFPDDPRPIQLVTILGRPPLPDDTDEHKKENRRMMEAIDARWVTYDQLVLEAERSYAEYLNQEQKVLQLMATLERLDADFDKSAARNRERRK